MDLLFPLKVNWNRVQLCIFICLLQSLTTVEESNEKDVENQLEALRSHLLALGKTEGQLQALKEKSIELAPAKPETSVVEILQVL